MPTDPMTLSTGRGPYGPRERSLLGVEHAGQVASMLHGCPAHVATPLRAVPGVAGRADVGAVLVKDESGRMGLGSFKALGGAYAVAGVLVAASERELGRPVAPAELVTSPQVRAVTAEVTVTCASAGNHGLSVAAGARLFGASAVVWLSSAVPETFVDRVTALGARVRRAGGEYAESMAAAVAASETEGWELVADSSWPGYTAVPLEVMRGYTLLVAEAADALDADGGPATHVFVQAGVGGLAAAVAGYLRDRWGEAPRLVIVEPDAAACLLASARAGRLTRIRGGVTALGRLDCLEPSLLAWQLLFRLADAFMTVSDRSAAAAAGLLAAEGVSVSAGGAAGAAGLMQLAADRGARDALGLGKRSRVLLFGTETAAFA